MSTREARSLIRAPALAVWVVAFALVAASCAAGGLPPAGSPATPGSATPAASTTAAPALTGVPAPVASGASPDQGASGPPQALAGGLRRPAGGTVPGALGTYTWDDAGSDAPWFVPADGGRAAPGDALTVTFEPARTGLHWIARWAPVVGMAAGDIAETAEGAGAIVLAAPGRGGTWSLQLEVRFAQGRGATWYWRMEVAP